MIIHEMRINRKYLLKISRETVNGVSFGHIRLWAKDLSNDQIVPTKKGFGFDLCHLDDIINGLIILKCFHESALYEA